MSVMTVVTHDEWIGVYIDGILGEQGYASKFHPEYWVKLTISKSVHSFRQVSLDERWMKNNKFFPSNLSDVKLHEYYTPRI